MCFVVSKMSVQKVQKIEDLTLLMYTHTDYQDLWQLNFNRIQTTFPFLSLIVAVNDQAALQRFVDTLSNNEQIKLIEYVDTNTYAQKMSTCIKQVPTTYVLFMHDNNVIYHNDHAIFHQLFETFKSVDGDRLGMYMEMSTNKNNIISLPHQEKHVGIQKITDYFYYFNVQTSIWKTHAFLDILNAFPSYSYRQIEHAEVQEYARQRYAMYCLAYDSNNIYCHGFYFPFYFQFMHVTSFRCWVSFYWMMDLKEQWRELFETYQLDRNKRDWNCERKWN